MKNLDKNLDGLKKDKITGANRRLAKKRVHWFIEALCFVSSVVLADSSVLRNPPLRQVPKRYAPCYQISANSTPKSHYKINGGSEKIY